MPIKLAHIFYFVNVYPTPDAWGGVVGLIHPSFSPSPNGEETGGMRLTHFPTASNFRQG